METHRGHLRFLTPYPRVETIFYKRENTNEWAVWSEKTGHDIKQFNIIFIWRRLPKQKLLGQIFCSSLKITLRPTQVISWLSLPLHLNERIYIKISVQQVFMKSQSKTLKCIHKPYSSGKAIQGPID